MSADASVAALCDAFWEWRLKESPEFAAYCGVHDCDDLWDDTSENAVKQTNLAVKRFMSQADDIKSDLCSKEEQQNLLLLKDTLKVYLDGSEFRCFLLPVSFLEGVHDLNDTFSFLVFNSQEDFQKYVAKLRRLPQKIAQVEAVLGQSIEEKFTNHQRSMNAVPGQISSLLDTKADESLFLKPFHEASATIDPKVISSLKDEAINLVNSQIYPAYRKLKEMIENQYMKNLRQAEGVSSLANGAQLYQKCLDYHLSCHMTPAEIHELGQKEVKRIHESMLKIAEEEGFTGENAAAKFKELLSSDKFHFKSADEVLNYVKHISMNLIRPKLPSIIKNIPDLQLIIQPVPPSRATSPAAFYMSGTYDGSRPGVYYVNANKLESCHKYEFMALSLHEGEPGHHTQTMYCQTHSKTPAFRQYLEDQKYYLAPSKFPAYTAHIEGWGLYSEALGEELGLYEDRYSLFGRYSFEMLRAARLVVDTGLHAMGWSWQDAVKYLVDYTMSDTWTMTNEIDRYITWPGQACAYKIGELKIWDLRHQAEKKLGDNFDVREFHEAVIGSGSIPLSLLETKVDEYIQDNTK
ncbi:uncharacterized protein LOC121381379 [Gigantopelta aegis]|uniref:uncharacterized protein LOC121381379 n=1 Tax=Gigantopelta aegis TaxID=1735272 RepID=UPI001B889FDA|nr:uncharacterized protein LOC121381379 [Gigantopelta aegis]